MMRAFGLIGLLLALVIVLLLVKREMGAGLMPAVPDLTHVTQSLPLAAWPSELSSAPASAPRNAREQSQLIQQQTRQAVENATLHPMQNAPADAQ